MASLLDDNLILPAKHHRGNVLMWIIEEDALAEDELGGRGLTLLDGPAWARFLETYDPEFSGLPDDLAGGLYVMEISVSYDTNRYGDEENVVAHVHRWRRLPAPTRQRLIESPFEDFLGVSA
jgi:hypothetical protein